MKFYSLALTTLLIIISTKSLASTNTINKSNKQNNNPQINSAWNDFQNEAVNAYSMYFSDMKQNCEANKEVSLLLWFNSGLLAQANADNNKNKSYISITDKINNDSSFRKNFLETWNHINALLEPQIKSWEKNSNGNDLCAANWNIALMNYNYLKLYAIAAETEEQKQENQFQQNDFSETKKQVINIINQIEIYQSSALQIYSDNARQNNIFATKTLCANNWILSSSPFDNQEQRTIAFSNSQDAEICEKAIKSDDYTQDEKNRAFLTILMWYLPTHISNYDQFLMFNASIGIKFNPEYLSNIINQANLCNKYFNDISDHTTTPFCFIPAINLGEYYYHQQNYNDSFYWFNWLTSHSVLTQLSLEGQSDVQFKLGYMYQYGLGIIKDLDQALYWYQQVLKTSENNMAAIGNIGNIYVEKQDYVNAFQFCEKAAKLGNANSQLVLALMYENGNGTLQNYIEAYAWISVAVATGFNQQQYSQYQQNQQSAEQLRYNLQQTLLQQDPGGKQLAEAKKLAQEYYEKYVLKQYTTASSSEKNKEISNHKNGYLNRLWNKFFD